ncbi:HU family DNA-binding protein [Stutzerimonas nitrititolerans]|uniref:HU family DNA-binding protein n=1 Tax=Stutzerimonas nitrititolerans TaxID=2482751 RepID=UPI0028A5BF49|nr:HU family DNA-binding protein [Stutzerimonas nitrititolerans]
MNKQELIEQVAFASDLTKSQAKKAVEAVTAVIQDALADGQAVNITGFGVFETTTRSARIGRNPATGASLDVPASRGVRFRPGKPLKDAVK